MVIILNINLQSGYEMTAIDGEIGASLVGAFIGGDCADLYFERDRVIRQEFEQAVVGLIEGE